MKILLTADWHIRGDAPACRINPDEWLDDQIKSIEQLIPIADKCDEMWILGDLFHRARTSTEATVIASTTLKKFTKPIRILVGNHDELNHQYENVPKSTIGEILVYYPELQCHNIGARIVAAYPFGTEPNLIKHSDIWATHQLVFPDNESRPHNSMGKSITNIGVIAEELLSRSDAKVIVTGDYHHGYVKDFGDRKVITPGCLNIQASDMDDYEPMCFILDTNTYEVEKVKLKTFGKVHKDPKRESQQELNTYIEGLQNFEVPHLDFVANVKEASLEAPIGVREAVEDVLDSYNPEASN